MTRDRHKGERGQVLVLSAIVMALLFLPLSIYVIDTALVESGYAQLGEALQASAEDGASSIDQSIYRSSNGHTVVLDAANAREETDRSMRISRLPGLESWSMVVTNRTVTVTGRLKVQLLVLGSTTLTETRSASLAFGQ